MSALRIILLLAGAALATACASQAILGDAPLASQVEADAASDAASPIDASPETLAPGIYELLLTTRSDGCAVGLVPGEVYPVDVSLRGEGDAVVGEVLGLAALTFGSLVGTARFSGTNEATGLRLFAPGTIPRVEAGCEYTVEAEISATVRPGALTNGSVTYRRRLLDEAACGSLTCSSLQEFSAFLDSTRDQ